MKTKIPKHIEDLKAYLNQPSERNEDLALSYFRQLFDGKFKRQDDAKGADGYVPGHLVIELKGNDKQWYAGLFQALAYKNKGLSFSMIIVAAQHFLAVWKTEDIPDNIRIEISQDKDAPSAIGKRYARKYANLKKTILRKHIWYRPELFEKGVGDHGLFSSEHDFFEAIKNLEALLKQGHKIRQPITLENFVKVLQEMRRFFQHDQAIKTVRAFYSMISESWDESSVVTLSQQYPDRATYGAAQITNLIPSKREEFKEFIDRYVFRPEQGENVDDFFSQFDKAIDAVDKQFRVKHGMFFTDLDLSKFVMYFVRRQMPKLGKNYLVIDPACGSGNLVTNWKSPLELRHKVVSEIEPELLYAVEQRMKGDQWHNGKFTVVPKVSENQGLNFLDISAEEYLGILKEHLKDKGLKPDKPLAFLCNPPYRSDDNQSAGNAPYNVHNSIIEMIGKDASAERYMCFLAQMKLICKVAEESGLPDNSTLLLFTKAIWLTDRQVSQSIRNEILGSFDFINGVIVNAREFFDVSGKFPIAFTMWQYRGENAGLDAKRNIPLLDLTWLTKKDLTDIPWLDEDKRDKCCEKILQSKKTEKIFYGNRGRNIKDWSGLKRHDFQREKRISEIDDKHFRCGLPKGDHRHARKKTLGESDGKYIGFMDDLTPCRIPKSSGNGPWFSLNPRIMSIRKSRCFSGPPDCYGQIATDLSSAEKLCFWYSLCKMFLLKGYPIWADPLEFWEPHIPKKLVDKIRLYSFAIVFSENECVQTIFPENNPIKGSIEIRIENPLSPLYCESFWSEIMHPSLRLHESPTAANLIRAVEAIFTTWKHIFRIKKEIHPPYNKHYFVGDGILTQGAGLIQIKDYANHFEHQELLIKFNKMEKLLKETKEEFYNHLIAEKGLNYFGQSSRQDIIPFNPKAYATKSMDSLKKAA